MKMPLINWATSSENVTSVIFDQVRVKPASSATGASYNLETLGIASVHIILSKQRTPKVLIRLRGCAFVVRIWYKTRFRMIWPNCQNTCGKEIGNASPGRIGNCVTDDVGFIVVAVPRLLHPRANDDKIAPLGIYLIIMQSYYFNSIMLIVCIVYKLYS